MLFFLFLLFVPSHCFPIINTTIVEKTPSELQADNAWAFRFLLNNSRDVVTLIAGRTYTIEMDDSSYTFVLRTSHESTGNGGIIFGQYIQTHKQISRFHFTLQCCTLVLVK
jgi:hypothetical protein